MRLKSFFANTIEEAIQEARQELGPDAMLVNSKRTGVEAQHLGLYEVVVCTESPEPRQRTSISNAEHSQENGPAGRNGSGSVTALLPVDRICQDVAELKQRMEKLALTLARSGHGMAGMAFDAERSQAFTVLSDAEVDTELAYDVVGSLNAPISGTALMAELAKLIKVDSRLGVDGLASRVVALVGPPGAGKTSALVKLAIQYGLAAGKTVQVLTTDTYRIAAADELRSYAAILGIGCQVLDTPAALTRALGEGGKEGCRSKDLILIDTPGLCGAEMDACEDLAEVVATHPEIDTHLVLPASMRAADLIRVSGPYSIFRPQKLLFTRMDETETLGPILSLSVRMGKPVSFFSSGQRIPEDLRPATPDLLLDSILGPLEAGTPKFDVVGA